MALAAAASAQQGAIDGPVSGFVFDSNARSLRMIRGIPGAALIGGPVDFKQDLTRAWVAPGLDSALVVTADGAARAFRLDGAKAAEIAAAGLVAPERVVYSPSGTAMALVTAGSVRIYSGLPGAPTVTGTVALPADRTVAAGPRAKLQRPGGGPIAVSDDGRYLLYGNGPVVELMDANGNTRTLTEASAAAIPTFAPRGHDAAVTDKESVALFQDVAGAATVRRLPGISGARAATFSPDGNRLFVAGASLVSLDVAGNERAELSCDCRVSGLTRMGSVYRLTELGNGPLWLLDAAAEPRVVFVPADK
jgi:hypothetical protein